MATNSHAIAINGSNQYLNANDSASLSFTGNFTIEFWIKVVTAPGASVQRYLVTKDDESSQRAWASYYGNAVYGAGKELNFFVFNGGAYSRMNFQIDLGTGVWRHVAFVCTIANAVATKGELFIDGISQGNGTGFNSGGGVTAMTNTTSKMVIGAFDGGSGNSGLDCQLDDLRIWDDARTATEIAENYNTQLVGNESNLQAYYKFNNALTDSTSNSNTLTNNGSATFGTAVPYPEDGQLAFNNSAADGTATSAASVLNLPLQVSGLNRIILLQVVSISGNTPTSVVRNGTAFTEIGAISPYNPGRIHRYYYQVAPTVGSYDIVITMPSTDTNILGAAIAYVGAKQTGIPDASNNNFVSSGSSITGTLTSVLANCHLVGFVGDESGPYGMSAGTDTVLGAKQPVYRNNWIQGARSTTFRAAGSNSIAVSAAASSQLTLQTISIAPFISSVTYNQTLDATAVAVTATITRAMTYVKTLAATAAVTASITKLHNFLKTLSATATVTANLAKGLAYTMGATVAVTANMTAERVFLITMNAITAVTSNLTKTHAYVRTLAANVAVSAIMAKQIALSQILSATAAITAEMTAGRTIIMNAAVAVTSTMTSAIGKTLTASVSIVSRILAPFWRTKYPAHGDDDDYEIKYPHD